MTNTKELYLDQEGSKFSANLTTIVEMKTLWVVIDAIIFCRKECRQSNSTAYNIEWVRIFQYIKRIKRHSFERLGHSCVYSMGLPHIRSSHYTRNGIMFLQHLQRDDISLSDMEFEIADFRQADIGLIMPPYVSSLTQINSSNLNRLSNIVRLWRWR